MTSVQWKRVPLKMINAEGQVTEVITEVAEQIGFSDVKEKQREAILAFLSGKDTFCFYSHFCLVSTYQMTKVVVLFGLCLSVH